jgi:DNA gyrase/topoisomerase IV subunit A
MKNFSLLLLLSILFQSCFSYKTVDYNNIAIEKKQKFEVKGVKGKYIKGRLVSKDEQLMILENNGQLQEISVDEINEVKVRTFSIWKTAGRTYLSFAIGALAIGVLLAGTAL